MGIQCGDPRHTGCAESRLCQEPHSRKDGRPLEKAVCNQRLNPNLAGAKGPQLVEVNPRRVGARIPRLLNAAPGRSVHREFIARCTWVSPTGGRTARGPLGGHNALDHGSSLRNPCHHPAAQRLAAGDPAGGTSGVSRRSGVRAAQERRSSRVHSGRGGHPRAQYTSPRTTSRRQKSRSARPP